MRAYCDWQKTPLADPRRATVPQLIHGMSLIIEAEGPIVASRVFGLFARAGDLGRITAATQKRFDLALEKAQEDEVILASSEHDPENPVLRLPDQPSVDIRTLGSRSLHEVPIDEIAENMLEILVRDDLISREEIFREILGQYGLIRLTTASRKRLETALALVTK